MLYIVTKRFIIKKMIMNLMKGEMLYESKCKGDAKIKLNMGESVILRETIPFVCVAFPQNILTFHKRLTIMISI